MGPNKARFLLVLLRKSAPPKHQRRLSQIGSLFVRREYSVQAIRLRDMPDLLFAKAADYHNRRKGPGLPPRDLRATIGSLVLS